MSRRALARCDLPWSLRCQCGTWVVRCAAARRVSSPRPPGPASALRVCPLFVCMVLGMCAVAVCAVPRPPAATILQTTGHGGGSARRRTRAARVSVPSRKTRDSPRHCSEPSAHSLTVYGSRPMAHLHLWVRPSMSPRPGRSPDRSDAPQSESHVIHASKAWNLEAELSKCIRPVWGSQATRTLH